MRPALPSTARPNERTPGRVPLHRVVTAELGTRRAVLPTMSTFMPVQDLFHGPLHRILGSDRRQAVRGQDVQDLALEDVEAPGPDGGEMPVGIDPGVEEDEFDETLDHDHDQALGSENYHGSDPGHVYHDESGMEDGQDGPSSESPGSRDDNPTAHVTLGDTLLGVTNALNPEDAPDYLECPKCHDTLPKQHFFKNGRLMRTCRKHRVGARESDWSTFLQAVERARSIGLEPFSFSARIPMSSFPPIDALDQVDNSMGRTRAVKAFLNEVHRKMGYRFQMRNTWRVGVTWVAKCMCVQDKHWSEVSSYKTKSITTLSEKDKFHCGSHLTLRIRYDERTFDLELDHASWHPCPLKSKPVSYRLPSAEAALGPAPTQAPAPTSTTLNPSHPRLVTLPHHQLLRQDEENDTLEENETMLRQTPRVLGIPRPTSPIVQPQASPPDALGGGQGYFGHGSGVGSSAGSGAGSGASSGPRKMPPPQVPAMRLQDEGLDRAPSVPRNIGGKRPRPASFGQPAHSARPSDPNRRGSVRPSLPVRIRPVEIVATPNSDSFNYCLNILRRGADIMEQFREYMCEDENFQQFRQFFTGIETFVNAYEADAHGRS